MFYPCVARFAMISVTVTNYDGEKNPHHFLSKIAAIIPRCRALEQDEQDAGYEAYYRKVAALLLMVRPCKCAGKTNSYTSSPSDGPHLLIKGVD